MQPGSVEEWANEGAHDVLEYLDEEDELDARFVATLIRAAYGRGYINALSEPEPLSTDQAVRNREMLLLKLPV